MKKLTGFFNPISIKFTWKDCFQRFATICLFLLLFSSQSIAQVVLPPPDIDCPSQDLEVISAILPAPATDPCSCTGTRTLQLGIINKTGSGRTAFAMWGKLIRKDASGNVIGIPEIIFACASGILPGTTQYYPTNTPITVNCNESIEIVDVILAWTSANKKENCDYLFKNPAGISPKCGRADTIRVETGVEIDSDETPATCTANGSIKVSPFGGIAPYKVKIGTDERTGIPAGGATTFNLPAGTYSILITDSRNCSVTRSRTILSSSVPTVSAGSPFTKTCAQNASGKQIGEDPVSGFTYSWSPTSGLSNNSIGNPTADPTSTTTYTVTKTNISTGCSNTASVIVTVDDTAPTANAGEDVTINCTNTSATLTATGGGTYSWSPGGETAASITVTPAITTDYTVTVTAANGCTATDIVRVTVDKTAPIANAGDDKTINCINTSATLTATGGGAYLWSPGGATTASIIVTPATTTDYTVTVTAANGCTATDVVRVTVDNTIPTLTLSASPVSINTTITTTSLLGIATISPGDISDYDYSWTIFSKPDGSSASLTNPLTATPGLNILSPYTPGSYVVQVTATHKITGCSNTATINVPVPIPGTLPCSVDGASSVCPGTTNTYNGPSPIPDDYTYTWSVTGGGTIVGETNGTSFQVQASSSCNTSYTVKLHIQSSSGVISTDCEKTVSVKDDIIPVLAAAPSAVTVQCLADVPAMVNLTWTDNCSAGGSVTGVDGSLVGGACGGTITRTWNVSDACGNAAVTRTQIITVKDDIIPVLAAAPAAVTVQCLADVPAMVNLTWTDNCSAGGSVTGVDGSLIGGACGGTITRTWNVSDACGNAAVTRTQIITVKDDIAPTITFCPADIVIEACNSALTLPANTGSATATDNCSTVTPTYKDEVSPIGSCFTKLITRTWTATDDCGNSVTCVQRITVRDGTAPVITCNTDGTASATDNCSASVQLYFSNGKWTAIDESGNISTRDGCPVTNGISPVTEQKSQVVTGTQKNSATTQIMQEPLGKELKVQAYPNPFSSNVKFMISSPVKGRGTLEVFNTTGQKIRTVYTDFMVAGIQTVELSFPSTQVTNLVYVLRIGDKQVTGKLVKINQ